MPSGLDGVASDDEARDRLLALHAIRILGATSATGAAEVFQLDREWVAEHLLDLEAIGLVRRTRWDGLDVWSLSESGKAANESALRVERIARDATFLTEWALETFEAVNSRFTAACTAWQLGERSRERGISPGALREFTYCGARLAEITGELATRLPRFGVHRGRYDAALERVRAGHAAWIDSPALPSLHLVWMGAHEDLLATLGLQRGR